MESKETSLISMQLEKKKESSLRFLVLLFLCLMSSCFIFSYNSPGALQNEVMNQFSLNSFWFSVIYSAFYWPNIVCFVGGYLLERVLGVKYGTIIFVSLSVIGNVVCAAGGFLSNYWLMVLGRFLYGCAGDSVAVSLNLYAILWFRGKELGMVMAVNQSFPMVGASLVYQIAQPLLTYIRNYTSGNNALGITFLIISATTLISVVCSVLLAILYPKPKETLISSNQIYQKDIIKLSDLKIFPVQFWILCIICDLFFNSVFTFIDLAQNFLIQKYSIDADTANEVISSFSVISCLTSPIFGILVDYMGRNIYFAALSILASIASHFMAAFTLFNPYIIMFMISMSFSLMIGSIWPLFSLLADKHQQGSVYGFVLATMNGAMAIGVLVSGRVIDEYGYQVLEVYYLLTLLVVLGLTILLWIIDVKRNGVLNKSPMERLFSQQSLNKSVSLERLH